MGLRFYRYNSLRLCKEAYIVIMLLIKSLADWPIFFQIKGHIKYLITAFCWALHTGVGGVRAGPHCRIRIRETVHTDAESRENFYVFWIRLGQNEQRTLDLLKIRLPTSNLMQAPPSPYVRNFQILKASPSYIILVVSASHNKHFL